MTHQDGILQILFRILSANEEAVRAFLRGNPFDKLLRSYSEFTADGKGLYKSDRAFQHCRMSSKAQQEYESGKRMKDLYQEHRVPLSIIRDRLLKSDRTLDAINHIMQDNEIVIITRQEQQYLDNATENGGLGLKSTMPKNGQCRLVYAGIQLEAKPQSPPC